jgi:pimeloyl-ACP methyl ester carboxylesterase
MHPILDHPTLSARLYFPYRTPLDGAFRVDVGDAELACSLHAPHPEAPLLCHFHGNGETVADYPAAMIEALASLGVNVFLAEYRGYGASSGTPSLGTMLEDVAPTLAALPVPPERLILFGRSIGSLCAIRGVRLHPEVAGLVIESGVADPLERVLMRATPAELGTTMPALEQAIREELDHQAIMRAYHGPLLVMHTRFDGLIDVEHAQRLHEWAGGPKRLRVFEDGDHSSILFANAGDYLDELRRFLASIATA